MARGKDKNKGGGDELAGVITLKSIMREAGPVYFGRGEEYFHSGLVSGLVDYNGRISAKVQGTRRYEVELWSEDGSLGHSCSCPLGEDAEFCKHCVAVALEWLKQTGGKNAKPGRAKKKAVDFKDVKKYLLGLDREVLADMVMESARGDDLLRSRLLSRAARASAKGLDLDDLKAVIDSAVDGDDFVDYRKAAGYAAGIEDAIDSIDELLQEGHANEAIELAEHALTSVERVIERVDDSDGELSMILERLQKTHLDACRKAKPDPETLARRLFQWELTSDWEVFYHAAETYAKVLGQKGLAVYRRLAEEKWRQVCAIQPGEENAALRHGNRRRITRIMEALARGTGDLEELVAIKSRDLSSPYHFLEIAQLYRDDKQHDKAREWAERGMKSFGGERRDPRLLEFLAEEYHRAKKPDQAMQLVWSIFTASSTRDHYQLLKTHADKIKEWPDWREQALGYIRHNLEERKAGQKTPAPAWSRLDYSDLVEIFLWENNLDAAWEEARKGGCHHRLWLALAKKSEKGRPGDAVEAYQLVLGPVIAQKNNHAYHEAVDILKKIRGLMLGLGMTEEYEKYLASLIYTHKPKRNFIKFLGQAKLAGT